KSEWNQVDVDWIISDQQSFSVIENKKFIKMMNFFDFRYKILEQHQIKELTILEFNNCRSKIKYDLNKISGKVSFTADM
ncbi:14760_t:CDS:1, partial [Funneliformis geosporum]